MGPNQIQIIKNNIQQRQHQHQYPHPHPNQQQQQQQQKQTKFMYGDSPSPPPPNNHHGSKYGGSQDLSHTRLSSSANLQASSGYISGGFLKFWKGLNGNLTLSWGFQNWIHEVVHSFLNRFRHRSVQNRLWNSSTFCHGLEQNSHEKWHMPIKWEYAYNFFPMKYWTN